MSTTLEKSIVVDRPVGWVYDQWTQLEDFERYAPGVERVEQVGPARIRATVKKRGVTRTWDAVITEQLPDARIAWASERWLSAAAGGDDDTVTDDADDADDAGDADDADDAEGPQHAGVVTFHQLDDEHTKVMLQFDFEPHGFLEWYADGVGLVRSWADSVLEDFKSFVEDREWPTGAWRGTIRDGEVVDDGDARADAGTGTDATRGDDRRAGYGPDDETDPTGGDDDADDARIMADGEVLTS